MEVCEFENHLEQLYLWLTLPTSDQRLSYRLKELRTQMELCALKFENRIEQLYHWLALPTPDQRVSYRVNESDSNGTVYVKVCESH